MKRLFYYSAAILFCLFFTACNAARPDQTAFSPEDFSLSQGQSITVDINDGAADITQAQNQAVQISGTLSNSKVMPYQATLEADGLHIIESNGGTTLFQAEAAPAHLNLQVPAGIFMKITSYAAAIAVHDYSGSINISSVAGDISVNHVSGPLSLISNRGNISVENSKGEFHLDGNYGQLSLLNSSGVIHATTIVGTISFRGKIAGGDNVSLETDHGAIGIQAGDDSNASVQINTTSGVVVCSMTGVYYEGQKCGGSLGSGQGKLQVRTVSGTVTLEPISH